MTISMTPEFKNASLYTCTNGAYAANTDWCDAILKELERDCAKDETIAEQCQRIGPIEVMAYKPTPIEPDWIASEVDAMMELFEENFQEVHGCDEHESEPWTKDTREWASKVLFANLTKSLRSATTRACEQIGSHTFSVEECIEMMK